MLNRGQQSKQPKVPDANNATTSRLDMSSAPGVWTTGPAFAQGRADFGLAYDAGTNKLYALGGDTTGGGFFDSTNLVDELSVASWPAGSWAASPPNLILPNRQANQAGFYGSGQIWSVGGIVGQTFQFLAEVQRRSNGSVCGSPTPTGTPTATPTASPSGTPTATPTAPATATPTAPATATPTASPTCTPSSFRVLIAYADKGGPPSTLQSQILAEPGVTAVDLFDAFSGTPTLAQLTPYNIVVAFSNNEYADAVGMGNVLADYADTGGVVVGLNFDWFGPPFGLDGRWITGGYTPFNIGPTNFSTSCLGTYDTTHPLMQGISAGSLCAFFRHTLTLSPGAVSVAMYEDSQQLCAYKTNNGHTGVGINAYLGENPMDFSGPFGRVIVNAGRWLISGPCGTPTPTPTATASCTPSSFHVLIAYSDTTVPTQLQSEILAEPGVIGGRSLRCASRHSHPGSIAAVPDRGAVQQFPIPRPGYAW